MRNGGASAEMKRSSNVTELQNADQRSDVEPVRGELYSSRSKVSSVEGKDIEEVCVNYSDERIAIDDHDNVCRVMLKPVVNRTA